MSYVDAQFTVPALRDEAAVRRSFASLYRWGFAAVVVSVLFFLSSALPPLRLTGIVLGAMFQIDAVLCFLYAGLYKLAWELEQSRRSGESG